MTEPPASGARPHDPAADWEETPESNTSAAPSGETAAPPEERPGQDPLSGTRTSRTWIAIIVFAIILILLLIFIIENTQKVEISYFGATGHLPLAVAMLLAAVAGVLLTAIAGTIRILQLRRRVKKDRKRGRRG